KAYHLHRSLNTPIPSRQILAQLPPASYRRTEYQKTDQQYSPEARVSTFPSREILYSFFITFFLLLFLKLAIISCRLAGRRQFIFRHPWPSLSRTRAVIRLRPLLSRPFTSR